MGYFLPLISKLAFGPISKHNELSENHQFEQQIKLCNYFILKHINKNLSHYVVANDTLFSIFTSDDFDIVMA